MPIYEYLCECGKKFQTIQSINEPKLKTCTLPGQDGKSCKKKRQGPKIDQ
jgi:putative FmdB family regulatory protein